LATEGPCLAIAAPLRAVHFLAALAAIAILVPPVGSERHAPAWPQAGSTVEYDLRTSFTVPDGSYRREATARLALVYDGAAWTGTCSGETLEVVDGVATRSEWSSPSGGGPAFEQSDVRRGDLVTMALLDDAGVAEGCRQRGETLEVTAKDRHGTAVEDGRGRPIARTSWVAEELPESGAYQDISIAWDRQSGLALDWTRALRTGSSSGRLVATDAFGA
jgi:hypothetical protein